MKQIFKTQDLEDVFQNERLNENQMDYLRGGDGPAGGDQPTTDDPPILPPPTPDPI